jgi:proteasome lid subunit RPN8/RPN11
MGGTGVSGFSPMKERFDGQVQEFMFTEDLDTIDPVQENLVVGADKVVYEAKDGLIKCLSPVKPSEVDPLVYVEEIDWDSFPPIEELAHLYDEFFDKYPQEVLMVVGRLRDGSGWLYHVPEQEGSGGGVKWDAKDGEMEDFHNKARWVGTIHSHPGFNSSPSGIDVDEWAEPEKSGLHVIFGKGGSFTVSGAISGRTFVLYEDSLDRVERVPVEFTTSLGRDLDEVLKTPPQVHHFYEGGSCLTELVKNVDDADEPVVLTYHSGYSREENTDVAEEMMDWTEQSMDAISVSGFTKQELADVKVVRHNGLFYLMSAKKYEKLAYWCDKVCPTPTATSLCIRRKT